MASEQEQQQPADDWEQVADSDQNLSQQTSQMHISGQAPAFRPQAATFVPGSGGQHFYPQYNYQQGYPQASMYGAQPLYPQYGQSQYGYQQQQGGYGMQYGAQQQYQPQVLQRGPPPPTQTKKESGIISLDVA